MRVQAGNGGRRLAAAVVVLGVVLASALFGWGAPAQAIPVPVGVGATSGYNSVSPKFDVAICPNGEVVISGGGTITDGAGRVVLTSVALSLTTVRVMAAEVTAYSGDWSVSAYAVCGPEDDGFEATYVVGTGTATAKSAIATCPAGKRLYGTGYELRDTDGQVFPSVVRPDATLSSVTVRAEAHGGFTGDWSLIAYGICGKPATYMKLVTARSAPNPAASKTATTEACPGDTNVHGVGAEIFGGLGDVVLETMAPTSISLTGAHAAAAEHAPVTGNWSVTSYAICSS
jgi:hypothetical protein